MMLDEHTSFSSLLRFLGGDVIKRHPHTVLLASLALPYSVQYFRRWEVAFVYLEQHFVISGTLNYIPPFGWQVEYKGFNIEITVAI